eukprot:GHRQ01018415.1.p2 GENE.GHRQ01018415.1~~GHRQ01018415.1.p2  ORF type:complete len:136 (-),score=41.80 GHRQ01018415.1:532-939(-)
MTGELTSHGSCAGRSLLLEHVPVTHTAADADDLQSCGTLRGCVLPFVHAHCAEQDMQIMTKHGAVVKEMEAAAIAWVAQMFHKPMFCVKAVTDIVDGDRATQEEFLENLNAAAAALQQTLPKVLEFVAGKTIAQL